MSAQAQTVKFQNPSVTIYDLDGISNTASAPTRTATQNYNAPTIPAPSQEAIDNVAAGRVVTRAPVTTPSQSATQAPTAAPPPLDAGWLGAKWSGRVNLGASLQTGNTEQDAINGDASVKAKWHKFNGDPLHRASIKAEINRETENDDTTEDNRSIQGAYDYFVNKKWFINSTLGFEQDDIEKLDLRTTAGIGLGHQAFESDNLNLQYVIGPSYLREEYESGDTDDSAALRWALDYDQKILGSTLEAYHDHEIFVPVGDTNAFLLDTRTGLRIPLKAGLVVSGEVQFDWDNDPAPGTKEDDTTYAVKLGYEW